MKRLLLRCLLWASLYGFAHGAVFGMVHPLWFLTRRGRRRKRLYDNMYLRPRLRAFLEENIL